MDRSRHEPPDATRGAEEDGFYYDGAAADGRRSSCACVRCRPAEMCAAKVLEQAPLERVSGWLAKWSVRRGVQDSTGARAATRPGVGESDCCRSSASTGYADLGDHARESDSRPCGIAALVVYHGANHSVRSSEGLSRGSTSRRSRTRGCRRAPTGAGTLVPMNLVILRRRDRCTVFGDN